MSGERRIRILERLVASGLDDLSPAQLGEACRDATGVTGASIMLVVDDEVRGSVGATDPVSARIDELQLTLGEGPCVDAHRSGWPVLEPDLAHPGEHRWVAFSGPALEAGVRAIFGFPVRIGALRLGALDLYCDQPGPLTDEQHADAMLAAEVAAITLLALQADGTPGTVLRDLESGSGLAYVVHQASGMVSAQLDIPVGEALLRLRAHAFALDRPLDAVASDVVARRIRFSERDDA
jgi:GAF domain-containing protein